MNYHHSCQGTEGFRHRYLSGLLITSLVCSCLPGLLAADPVRSEPELFRPSTNPLLLHDDPGIDGIVSFADGLSYTVLQGYAIAEGDIMLGRVDANGRLLPHLQNRGLGRSRALDRWPDGIIPYQFGPNLRSQQIENIELAIAHWNERTSISMVERTTDNSASFDNYLVFITGNSCTSYVGRTGGKQDIWIADSCAAGSIIHEIGHAIGLFHEHTRPDRDNYIQVQFDNVKDDYTHNFSITAAGSSPYGDYDYGSIMHYGDYFFTNNGEPTIVPLKEANIGQRLELSALDAASVDMMYATDLALDATSTIVPDKVEIDVVISNIGNLGANTLALAVTIGQDADWISISTDSGWDCMAYGEELRCTRDTFPEGTVSRFTLEVDPVSGSVADLSMKLSSRTIDLEPLNNVINAEAEQKFVMPSAPVFADSTAITNGVSLSSGTPSSSIPDPVPGQTVGLPESGAALAAADTSAGSSTGYLSTLMLMLLAIRRRYIAIT